MEIKNINEHFKYYLENETQFISSNRYIYVSKRCKTAYSFVYSNLLMNICSDFESLVRAYFDLENDEPMEINEIIEQISKDDNLKKVFDEKVSFESSDYGEFQPLNIVENRKTDKKSFKWWSAYNMIKHNKVAKIFHANQENVLNALGALYVLNRYVLFINADECHSDVFANDNHCFSLKDLKCRDISAGGIIFSSR